MKPCYAWALLAFLLVGCHMASRDTTLRRQYRYDKEDRLTEIVATDGSSTHYYCDKQGRLVSVKYPKGGIEYGYGDEGLIWTKDSEGSTEYFRDLLGRVSYMVWRRGGEKVVHLDLDPWGGLIGVSVYSLPAGSGTIADAVRVLRTPLSARKDVREKRMKALLSLQAAAAADPSIVEYAARYERDIFGRLTGMDSRAGRVGFTYRDDVREAERRLPNGIRTVWRYTANGQVESLVHYDPSGRALASWTYSYDGAGLITRVSEVIAGQSSEKQIRRDSKGILREVSAAGGSGETWQYDEYGRPVREGKSALEWNKASQVAAWTSNGQRLQLEYDGRDLPIRATGRNVQLRFRWDTEGRLESYGTPQNGYALLPDLTGTTGEPWMKWKAGARAPTSYFSDGAVYAEVDDRGGVRYLLRDGEGKVRFSADRDGRLNTAGKVANTRRTILAVDYDPTPAGGDDRVDQDEFAFQVATQTAQMIAELKQKEDTPELRGLLFNTKVQNYVADFLKSTPQSEVDFVFNGINADWHDAGIDNIAYYPDKRGLFIPLFASIPKVSDIPGCIWEKLTSAIPGVGEMMQTRKVDLAQILDQTAAAGKKVNSLTFESGAGFEEQRQVGALIEYSQKHPDQKLPTIYLVSTGADTADRESLRKARYDVRDIGKDPLVPLVVDSGPAASIPFVGRAISVPIQVGQAVSLVASAGFSGHWNSLLDGHGFDAQSAVVLRDQASTRTNPLGKFGASRPDSTMRDPTADARKELGGVELGAKASAAGNIGTIGGVMYDKDSQRVALLGDHKIAAEGLDAEDFAVALLMAYHDPPIVARFSLDPADPRKPDGKWLKAVYLPQETLAGTRMGQTMFITDWLMKQYSFGLSVDSDGKVGQLPRLPGGLLDEFAISFRNWHGQEKPIWTRLWIVADDFRIQVHGSALIFETAKMRVRAKRQIVDPSSPTGLRDDERQVDENSREFAERFTANYDKVAEESPEFHRLREMAKAVALAKWLHDSGVPVDLDWARQVAARRSQYVDKVPALSNGRQQVIKSTSVEGNHTVLNSKTREIRLTGGVDLEVKPLLMAEAPLAKEVSAVALGPLRNESSFVVDAGKSKLEGAVMPITRNGREAWTRAGRQIFGDATRTVDASGLPVELEYESGRKVVYSYPRNGQVGTAKVVDPNGQADLFQFGQDGKVVSGELRGHIKVIAKHEADGSLGSLRFTAPTGEQVEVAFGTRAGSATPAGGSRVTVLSGEQSLSRNFDARGNLVSVDVGGNTVASYGFDGQTATAWSGPYSESVTMSPDDGMRIYRRTAPDLDGKAVTQVARIPVAQFDRALTVMLPEGRVNLPSGSTMEVASQSRRGENILEIDQYPVKPDVVVGQNAAAIDAEGRIHQGGVVIGQLGTESAPLRMTVMDSPARVAELQSRFGAKTEFYKATDAKLAELNIGRMPLISNGSQVAVYLPPKAAEVEDFGVIDSIRNDLTGVRVETGMGATNSSVVIVNGHDSPALEHWVEDLGRSGALRDKVLVLNTCNAADSPEFNSLLIRKYGALAIHAYMDEISAQATKDVIMKFDELMSIPRSNPESILSLWRKAVDKAVEEAPTEWLRRQIELLRKGVTQVSRNEAFPQREGDLG